MTPLAPVPRSTPRAAVLAAALLGLPAGAALAAGEAAPGEPAPDAPLYPVTLEHPFPDAAATFDEARRLILERFYSKALSEEALYHAAIRGMLQHVSPPGQRELGKLWSPAQWREVADALAGVRSSIGVRSRFDPRDGSLTVREVVPGAPADGVLRPYDRIVRIGGHELGGLSLDEVNALLRGEPGATIALKVVRDIDVLDLELTVDPWKVENVVSAALPDGVGYVSVRKITRGVAAEFRAAVSALPGGAARRLIVDLRDNSGGVLLESLRMAETFLGRGTVLLRTLRHGERVRRFVSGNEAPFTAHLVVLVNARTASASEIFAAAVRARARARVVGTPTFGKATMEETFDLANGYRLKFIVGAMYAPDGRSWHGEGLAPDLEVPMDEDTARAVAKLPPRDRLARDAQLRAAWTLLRTGG